MIDLDTSDLSDLEHRFWGAAYTQDSCDLRDGNTDMATWGDDRTVRAHVIRAVLMRGIVKGMPDDTVISMKGIVIRGELADLDGVKVPPLQM
jgi:hypothetical protein